MSTEFQGQCLKDVYQCLRMSKAFKDIYQHNDYVQQCLKLSNIVKGFLKVSKDI